MDEIAAEAIVAASLSAPASPLEESIFGTEDPREIVELLRGYCLDHLGAELAALLFYRRGVGAVFGVRLADGQAAVVKVHRRELVGDRLEGIVQVQRYVAGRGLPAPRPLAEPVELGSGIATAEELLERTAMFDAHASDVRTAMADGLWAFVTTAKDLKGSVAIDAGPPFGLPADRRWPIPHDLRFELALPGGKWIDERADEARARLLEASGDEVIGHMDWRAENLGVEEGRVAAIFDWDSLGTLPEPALVGHTAAGFTADWSDPRQEPLPSQAESRRFVKDYEAARGRAFTGSERETADAAYVYSLAYNARCEHSDVALGVFPDPGIEHGWRGLLKASENASLFERANGGPSADDQGLVRRVKEVIFHIAVEADWSKAEISGRYVPASFREEGFVHCSYYWQVERVAHALFAGRRGLVLLRIDPDRLRADVRDERAEPDGPPDAQEFPHVYGPIDVDAVTGIWPFERGPDGGFELPADVLNEPGRPKP